MNYVAYKNIDGTITSGFKVKLYDIVTLNTGYWKDKLAIVLYINEDRKQIKVRIIECGMDLTLKVKDVQFVNHNNRTAARSYIDLCNKLSKAFRDKYTDKQYIKDNWFIDVFMINNITADTLAKATGQYITNNNDKYSVSAILWLTEIKDYIDALLKYGDFDFVAKAFKIYNITDTRFDLFVNFIIISMIENITLVAIGVCAGFVPFLIVEILKLYKKIERINIEINKLQMKDIELHRNIEFIINDSKSNKEVLEHFIDKLDELSDSIKAKV